MVNIIFINKLQAIAIHDKYIHEFGGSHGIRDHGLLESALFAPQATFNGQYLLQDIFHMAATYGHGIIKNHPFIDGNKRTGSLIPLAFLQQNGIILTFNTNEIWQLALHGYLSNNPRNSC